ncbi:MAG: thioredoxin domain-containing protein [Desulfovibrio sp.]|nr:thioredoxin domain-containing protein [Desulfovibrio sp.]
MFLSVFRYSSRFTAQVCFLVGLLCAFPAYAREALPSDEDLRPALERILKNHPEILMEILKENSETVLEIAQQGSILRKRKAALAQWENDVKQRKIVSLEDRPFRGDSNAPVTIVAYSDFTCPYCRQAEATMGQLLKKYEGTIRLTFKALPKEDMPLSQAAAKYSIAAFMVDHGKGWEFHDALFNGVEQLERDGEAFFKATAALVGLDFKKLKIDAGNLKIQERLDADRAEADKIGISGTPYFLVNDLVVRGAVSKDLFEDAIEMALRLSKKK